MDRRALHFASRWGKLETWNTDPCLRGLESLRIDKHAFVCFAWAEQMEQRQMGRLTCTGLSMSGSRRRSVVASSDECHQWHTSRSNEAADGLDTTQRC